MPDDLFAATLALLAGWLIGALPLGSTLVRRLTGKDPVAHSAHNLGVENVLRTLGPAAAGLSLAVDVLKGIAGVTLSLGSPWAAVGVFAGHLNPLLPRLKERVPRGRGNGVLLGALLALTAFGSLSWWQLVLAVAAYAVLLGLTRYVAVATLGSLATLLTLLLMFPPGNGLLTAGTALVVMALWRHKSSIARILDGTEVRLGDPPPILGQDPAVVRAAFMVHPLELSDLWQARSQWLMGRLVTLGLVKESWLHPLLPRLRPQLYAEVTGIRLADGRELRVLLIGGAMLPEQIRQQPEQAKRVAIQGARYARELGAEAFGLGAFWSTVGNKGLEIQQAVPEIAITNGGAYTAGTVRAAVPGLLEHFRRQGGSLKRATAAVVGANGVVAFGVARMIAGEVGRLLLIGRDAERLERSANSLRRKHADTVIEASTDIEAVGEADLIFTATSDPRPVIHARFVKPGAWIYDLGRPADVDESVREVPGVRIIPGGVVRPPGEMRSSIDIHFGEGLVPACMAETMIMTATRSFDRASLGPTTRSADIDFYLGEGERLGFEIITGDESVQPAEVLA